jgi:predicted double-glycine peptidase
MCADRISAGCAIGLVLVSAATCLAQIEIAPGLRVDRPAATLKDARDRNVVKQRFDFSCGAAALATILRYGLGTPVTERQVLGELFALLSEDEKVTVRRSGFSLLHLQRVAQQRGFAAQGFRLTPEQLPMLGGPVIVFIQPRGYKHFAVLRGVRGDRVYLADPSRGNIRMSARTFLHDWVQPDGQGIIFVVEPQSGVPAETPLTVARRSPRLPEQMTIQRLLSVGAPLLRLDTPLE